MGPLRPPRPRGLWRGAGHEGGGAGIIGSGFVEVMQEGKLHNEEAEHERTHAELMALDTRLRRLEAALEAKAALDVRLEAKLEAKAALDARLEAKLEAKAVLDARLEAKLDQLLAGAGQPVPGLRRTPRDDIPYY